MKKNLFLFICAISCLIATAEEITTMKNNDFVVTYKMISTYELNQLMGDKCGQNHLGQLTNYYIFGKIERTAPRSAFVVLEFKYSKMILPTKLKTQKNEIGWIESGVHNKRYFLMPLTMLLDKVPEGFDINNMKCNIIVKMVK